MVLKRFLCCFDVYEGSWVCGLCSLLFGAVRVYLQWFNLEFRQRLSKDQRQHLSIDFEKIQVISKLQLSAAAVAIVVSLLLLIGLCKRQRWLMCPWMAWEIVEELFSFCVIIFFAVAGVKLKYPVYLFEAITFFTCVYSLLCVYSFFHHLKQDELKRYNANVRITFDADDFEDDPERPLVQVNRLV